MAKTKAKTTTTPTTTPATEPKATKKATKKAAPKKDEAPVVVPEVTNEVVETPVVSASVDDAASLSAQMSELMTTFQRLSTEARSAVTKLRVLDKQYQRTIRVAQKSSNKKRKNSGAPRAPSGFVKPTLISKELASFLNKPHGTEMARTEVTKEINCYIRANQLQDKKNGRIILPDTKLTNLLKIGKGEELTYFNLQKYMSPHFAKMGNKTAPTTTA
jgi:chromatin remodeling complex protein RSC6|uniref:DM2 domain-containing protein n=1 Tax=viral metagenome TaxID=1070528 RepID=A0A6C0IMY0_9ZZZZ